MVIQSKKEPFHTARQVQEAVACGGKVSVDTVKRVLRNNGQLGRIAAKKPFLTKTHKRARLAWCKAHLHCTVDDWKKSFTPTNRSLNLIPNDVVSSEGQLA